MIGYRTDHGKWWALEYHIAAEVELGNEVPDVSHLIGYEAIWVTLELDDALRYGDDVYSVDLTGAIIIKTDPDGGYLYARQR